MRSFSKASPKVAGPVAIVRHWAHAWRCLAAWGAPLPATLQVEPRHGVRKNDRPVLGIAKPWACTALVRCTGDLPCDLATVLHELAHLAAPDGVNHGLRWRELFIHGACEALERTCEPNDFDMSASVESLDDQIEDAVRVWLA